MNRYNNLINDHFRACPLLVTGHDPHRNRDVRVHVIPGDFEVVGLSDGVDAWVTTINVEPSTLFEKVRKAMALFLEHGKAPSLSADAPSRRRFPSTSALPHRDAANAAAPAQTPLLRRR